MVNYDIEDDKHIARNAGNTFELLFQLLHEETTILRGHVQKFGRNVREFFEHHINKKDLYADNIIKIAAKAAKNVQGLEEFTDGGRRLGKSYVIPARTFVDIADVLLKDDEEDGVVCKISSRNPKWDKLPDYSPILIKEPDACEFQLWNRPMGSPCTMPEDDDERLSLPSTRATEWERDKIVTVEAQLALLTRQMQHLLQLQQKSKRPQSRSIRSPVQRGDSSEDEGRGASLNSVMCSPLLKPKPSKVDDAIASVNPPQGPPPPPPPLDLLKSIENKPIVQNKPEKIEKQRPVRPTAADLRNVQLRKVEARSPGGTPEAKKRTKLNGGMQDNSNVLADALLKRFNAINGNSFTEQDDQDTSWVDDE